MRLDVRVVLDNPGRSHAQSHSLMWRSGNPVALGMRSAAARGISAIIEQAGLTPHARQECEKRVIDQRFHPSSERVGLH